MSMNSKTYIHTYSSTYIHKSIHPYIHTYIHTNIHTYIHTYIHTNTHACLYMYIHVFLRASALSATIISALQRCRDMLKNTCKPYIYAYICLRAAAPASTTICTRCSCYDVLNNRRDVLKPPRSGFALCPHCGASKSRT